MAPFQFLTLLLTFLVDLTVIDGSVDYRNALAFASETNVCKTVQKIGITCKNCNSTVYCQVDSNQEWTETPAGNCPGNKKCVNNECVVADRCPIRNAKFSCKTPGLYPDPADCLKYYICIKTAQGLTAYEVECEGDKKYGFNPEKSLCSDLLPAIGQCKNYYVPVCKYPYEEILIPLTSIFVKCQYYIDENNKIFLDTLYPYQWRCDNGKVYNLATGKCP